MFKDLKEGTFSVIGLAGKITSYLKTAGVYNPRESLASYESISSLQTIRLLKINTPKFDGDPHKFLKFKSIFSNLIHEDTTIPNFRKLYALEGPAEEFI